MYRRSVMCVLLSLVAIPSSAQTVYGLFGLPPVSYPAGTRQVGTLDPTDGSVDLIGTSTSIDSDTITIGAGITAVSVGGNAMYFIGRDNGDDSSRIYTVDLDTGATTASFALSNFSFSEALGLWFDENTSTLWGFFADGGDRTLATVDPTDGTVGGTLYDALGGGTLTTAGGVFTGDADGQRVFFIGTLEGEEAQLWEVSTDDGSITPWPFEDWDQNTVQGIEWDAANSQLWMIIHQGTGRQLASYDFDEMAVIPAEGEIDFGDPVSTTQGLIAIDDASGQLFFIGRPDGGSWSVFTVEIPSGDASSQAIDDTSIQINGWAGFEVVPGPELSFTKDDGDLEAVPGDTVKWTLTASNAAGAGTAKGVQITETVPAETTFSAGDSSAGWACLPDGSAGSTCTISLPDISPASSEAVDFAVVIDASVDPNLTELSNTAVLSATNTTTDLEASDTTPVTAAAALTLVKSDGGATTTPGSTVVYAITAGNTGNADALGTTLSDSVPANTTFAAASSTAGWSCSDGAVAGTACTFDLGTFAGGGSTNVNFAVTVIATVPAGTTSITNQAMLTATNPASASASDTTPLTAAPALELIKTDGDTSTTPGSVVAFELGYANTGNEDAANAGLLETVPSQTTFNSASSTAGWVCVPDASAGSTCTLDLGTLGGGGSGTATFAVTVDDPVLAGTTVISNAASLEADNAPVSAEASDTTPVTAAPELTLVKSDGGVGTVPGDTLSYVLVFGNDGNENAAAVVLTETVSENTTFSAASSTPGWVCTPDDLAGSSCVFDIGDLDGGDSDLVFFALAVDDPVTAGTVEITNTASIDAENVDEPTVDVDTTPVTAEPDLSLAKDDGGITAEPNEVVPYSLTVGNDGNEGAADVALNETVPLNSMFDAAGSTAGWTCLPDNLAGSTCTLDVGTVAGGGATSAAVFAVRVVDPFPSAASEVANTATVAASNTIETAEASDTTPIDAKLDLAVTKSDGDLPTRPGGTISYLISWENLGNQSTAGVEITETVPEGTTFQPGPSTAGWVCEPDNTAGSTCAFAVGELASGASGSAAFAVLVADLGYGGQTTVGNTVSIADNGDLGDDTDLSNNSDSTVTPIDRSPPTVVAIDAVPGVGGIESCQQLDRSVARLAVELEDVFSGIVDADDPARYLVVAAGLDGDLSTSVCGPVFGDDVEVPIQQVTLTGEPMDVTATLELSTRIDDGIARLLVCDTVTDVAGNALDGDRDGQPGGDYVLTFRVDVGNGFANAHLDDCPEAPITLAPWQPAAAPGPTVEPTLDFDADSSSLSGSIVLSGVGGQVISVGQCLPVTGGHERVVEASVRVDEAVTTAFDLRLWCAFSDQPGCTVLGPPQILTTASIEPSLMPVWEVLSAGTFSPVTAGSAMCGLEAVGDTGADITFYLDDLFTDQPIFGDGFESGDTSAWTLTVP